MKKITRPIHTRVYVEEHSEMMLPLALVNHAEKYHSQMLSQVDEEVSKIGYLILASAIHLEKDVMRRKTIIALETKQVFMGKRRVHSPFSLEVLYAYRQGMKSIIVIK